MFLTKVEDYNQLAPLLLSGSEMTLASAKEIVFTKAEQAWKTLGSQNNSLAILIAFTILLAIHCAGGGGGCLHWVKAEVTALNPANTLSSRTFWQCSEYSQETLRCTELTKKQHFVIYGIQNGILNSFERNWHSQNSWGFCFLFCLFAGLFYK